MSFFDIKYKNEESMTATGINPFNATGDPEKALNVGIVVPYPIENLRIVTDSLQSTLTWDLPKVNGANVEPESYVVEILVATDPDTWELVEIVNERTCIDSVNAGTWVYRVQAVYLFNSVYYYSSYITISGEVSDYSPPRNFTATPTKTGVNLSWQAPASGTPDSYNVYKDGELLDNTTSLSYSHTVAEGNHTYNLRAVYGTFESAMLSVTASTLPAGEGTLENPYRIYDVEDLLELRAEIDNNSNYTVNKYWKLENNLDVSSLSSAYWGSPMIFKGNFDGNNKNISGMNYSGSSYNVGLFYLSVNSYPVLIKNLNFTNVSINNTDSSAISISVLAASAFGDSSNKVTIQNCSVSGTIVASNPSYLAGIVGQGGYLDIIGCTNNCSITVSTGSRVGGILSYINTGGLIVRQCINTGNISASSALRVGGILAEDSQLSVTVEKCYNTGNITGSTYVGGILGFCYIGTVSRTISKCYNLGTITGTNCVGGIAGNIASKMSLADSYSKGSVVRSSGSLTNFGGLVGAVNYGDVRRCYSTGAIALSGKGFIGSVSTSSGYKMLANYWDTETSGQTTSAGSTYNSSELPVGRTTVNMKIQSNYSTWDFTDVWDIESTINDGYPYLR